MLGLITQKGFSGLHYAVSRGNKEVVRYLCHRGARMDIRDETTGFTPLFLCIDKEINVEVLKVLLKYGATVTDVSLLAAVV